jgi:predicted thioesterase
MLEIGIKGEAAEVVSTSNSAKTMGSGELQVYATPAMVALMEQAAWKSVAPELEEGQGTVGVSMQVSHLSATPIGMKVTAKTELTAIDRRKLTFSVEAYDESGKIGEGTHERFIVANQTFQEKADSKKEG